MDKERHIWKIVGWSLVILAALTTIITITISNIISRPTNNAKQVQRSVWKVEKEIGKLIENNSDANQYTKNGIGLFIYHNDSLLFWNNNSVGPRIIRRRCVVEGDTICNLLTGDYYVRSFNKGQMTYIAFKLLNTTYKLENKYFENRFIPYNQLINNRIHFGTNEGFDIYSTQGNLLTRCQIEQNTKLRTPYREILYASFLLVFFTGILMIIGKRKTDENRKTNFRIEYGIVAIIMVAILFTYLYYRHTNNKENSEMKALAERLSEKRDIRFEKSFIGFAELLKTDTALRDMVFAESNVLSDVILGYSKELLFDETMKAYNATLTICEPNEEISVEPEGFVTNCDAYFLEKLANSNQKRVVDGLYFIDYYTLDPNYLGKIKIISGNSEQEKTLYFEFYKPVAPEGFGFPQLLQESNSMKPYDYSVAHYRDNILVYKYGKYIYPNFFKELKLKDKGFTNAQGYKHYASFDDEDNGIVITSIRKGWSEITAPFAIFLLAMLIPYLIIYWYAKPRRQEKSRNFRQRLQNVVFFTLAISFLAVGPVSVIYMRGLYNQKTSATQFETTRAIASEINNEIALKEQMDKASRKVWNELLQHFASVFFTDLNLYDLDGKLLATTRIEIFDYNLQAPLMNAEAYQAMHHNKALYFTHEERLGKGMYESTYIPLNDPVGNTIAYLNTPYFSSATELHKEIRNFILTYINIILILLAIALIFVINITNRLTKPLSLIQNKLGNIKIDQKNEFIEWKRQDEIGALIKQYNKLLVELEKSTAELKRTTTESAWRGVARQVAHEIKNSLTPMRLSVQLLQRNIETGKATPEQIQRTTNTLIEQIDALSDIASSFSRYAKLPENHPQPLDLAELVQNVVNLYDNTENISFVYTYDRTMDYTYNGDKTNLNIAIGNLVKNATQAIGNQSNGKIEVNLNTSDNNFIINVKDNGKGIKEEDKKQIFLPNFTTKTGGSGIGLSLTNNIIQSVGGQINFKSEEGKGAEFVIVLPKNSVPLPPETNSNK